MRPRSRSDAAVATAGPGLSSLAHFVMAAAPVLLALSVLLLAASGALASLR